MAIDYEEIGRKIGALVAEKNVSYGNSFHESCKIMEMLYPKGIPVEKYVSVLALIRILDKIQRLVTDPNYNGENSWQDIAGYCILMLGLNSKTEIPDTKNPFDNPMVSMLKEVENMMGNDPVLSLVGTGS